MGFNLKIKNDFGGYLLVFFEGIVSLKFSRILLEDPVLECLFYFHL